MASAPTFPSAIVSAKRGPNVGTLPSPQVLDLTPIDPPPANVGSNPNDVSDIGINNPRVSAVPPMQLPIRGEKRFIPENATAIAGTSLAATSDFYVTAAKQAFTDYVAVVIPHRGVNPSSGKPDPSFNAIYRFLINPQTAQVSRNTEDSQTFARGGWQFGLWGEGLVRVSMTGHTPGQYFADGLTDDYAYLTESWRNLQQLTMVYENNGYWFEGEEADEGPLAPGFTRRRIKKHQDLRLTVGNFIWSGMFDELSVTLDADHPFRAEFTFSFLAWKERPRQGSPYSRWGIQTNVERGHSYGAASYQAQENPSSDSSTGQITILPLSGSGLATGLLPPSVYSDVALEGVATGGTSTPTPSSIMFNPGEFIPFIV
jgi:hypothetical protein